MTFAPAGVAGIARWGAASLARSLRGSPGICKPHDNCAHDEREHGDRDEVEEDGAVPALDGIQQRAVVLPGKGFPDHLVREPRGRKAQPEQSLPQCEAALGWVEEPVGHHDDRKQLMNHIVDPWNLGIDIDGAQQDGEDTPATRQGAWPHVA